MEEVCSLDGPFSTFVVVKGDTHSLCEGEVEACHLLHLVLREDFLLPLGACLTNRVVGKLRHESTLEKRVTPVHCVSLKYRIRTDVRVLKAWHEMFCAKVPGLSKRRLRVYGSTDVVVEKPSKEDVECFVTDVEVVVMFRAAFSQRVLHGCQEGPLNLIGTGARFPRENRHGLGFRSKSTRDILGNVSCPDKCARTK